MVANNSKCEHMAKQPGIHPHPPKNNQEIPNAGKHQLGVKASPYDHIPESHVKMLPPGTAPPEFTFRPRNDYNVLAGESRQLADPLDFSGASTSKDSGHGLGHSMPSKKLHNDGQPGQKRQKLGLAKHAADKSRDEAEPEHVDPGLGPKQRAQGKDASGGSA